MVVDLSLDIRNSLLELVLLQLEQSLLLDSVEMLLLDLLDLLLVVLVQVLHPLDVLGDVDLLAVNSVLVGLVEVSLLPQLLPGGLGLVCDHVGLRQLNLHCIDLCSEFGILIMHVSYQSDLNVVEGSLLLKLVPLLLEDIQGLGHLEFLHKVPNEVIDDDIPLESLGDLLHHLCASLGLCLGLLLKFGFMFQGIEIVKVVVIVQVSVKNDIFDVLLLFRVSDLPVLKIVVIVL